MFQDTQHLSLGLLDFGALAAILACHALESWFHFWFAPELYTMDSGSHTCQRWRGFIRVCCCMIFGDHGSCRGGDTLTAMWKSYVLSKSECLPGPFVPTYKYVAEAVSLLILSLTDTSAV